MTEGICPVCAGTGRVPAGENRHKHVLAGYDANTDTLQCRNCGGQYMFGRPTGRVRLNREGVPCTHEYKSATVGRCLTQYTCVHCDERHTIDSGG